MKTQWKVGTDGWQLANAELLDKSFDNDGICYSGYVPRVKEKIQPEGKEGFRQNPLTKREQEIREYWQSRKDPINWLLVGHRYANIA